MTYQQSLKNITALLNFIRIYDKDSIFFDFSNASEFKIIFYNRESELEKIQTICTEKFNANLAMAMITLRENEHEHFHYYDTNIDYEFDLTASELVFDDSNHDYLQQSPAQIKLHVAQLLTKLKQM